MFLLPLEIKNENYLTHTKSVLNIYFNFFVNIILKYEGSIFIFFINELISRYFVNVSINNNNITTD